MQCLFNSMLFTQKNFTYNVAYLTNLSIFPEKSVEIYFLFKLENIRNLRFFLDQQTIPEDRIHNKNECDSTVGRHYVPDHQLGPWRPLPDPP